MNITKEQPKSQEELLREIVKLVTQIRANIVNLEWKLATATSQDIADLKTVLNWLKTP